MMNHAGGWMNGWMGGGMWIWTVIAVLVVVLLVVAINKLSKNVRARAALEMNFELRAKGRNA